MTVEIIRMMSEVLVLAVVIALVGAAIWTIIRNRNDNMDELILKSQIWCYSHNAYEDADPSFRSCFECGHNYQTEQELIDAMNEVIRQMNEDRTRMIKEGADPNDDMFIGRELEPVTNSTTINSCPHCVHDW